MKIITTSNGFKVKVSDIDFDYLSQFSWHALKSGNTHYARAWVDGGHKPNSL